MVESELVDWALSNVHMAKGTLLDVDMLNRIGGTLYAQFLGELLSLLGFSAVLQAVLHA